MPKFYVFLNGVWFALFWAARITEAPHWRSLRNEPGGASKWRP